ncbi:hypothetical protein NM688_g2297 [Phlebia brevispora]|uniref:Uncharacterized protein n=1 Tax=Phlebia brevispora TaxID=194682 RepID=A0ACC1T951_9APHY|nr:hypothetical protein NM688_g2297 [Phlebia brevispora]
MDRFKIDLAPSTITYLDARIACMTDDEKWLITSPNMEYIPTPLFGTIDLALGSDGNFGRADPILCPQVIVEGAQFPWIVAIQRQLPPSDPQSFLWQTLASSAVHKVPTSAVVISTISLALHAKYTDVARETEDLVRSFQEIYGPRYFPATYRDLVLQTCSFRQFILYINAWFHWHIALKKEYSIPPISLLASTDYMSGFTTSPAVAEDLFNYDIPVWFARNPQHLKGNEQVLREVLFVAPTTHLALPEDDVAFLKQHLEGRLKECCVSGPHHIDWIHHHCSSHIDIEKIPFPASHRETAASNTTAVMRHSYSTRATAAAAPPLQTISKTGTLISANDKAKFKPFVNSCMPPSIPQWTTALSSVDMLRLIPEESMWKYWLPEPQLLAWFSVMLNQPMRDGVVGPLRATPWREYLGTLELMKEHMSVRDTKRQKNNRIVQALFKTACGSKVLDDTVPAMWYGRPVEGFEGADWEKLCQEVAWEVFEVGFHYELEQLDLYMITPGEQMLNEQERLTMLATVFPPYRGLLLKSIPSTWDGLAAESRLERAPYLDALRTVVSRWPHTPATIVLVPLFVNITSEPLFDKFELALLKFYCQSFFDIAGHAPMIPHRVPKSPTRNSYLSHLKHAFSSQPASILSLFMSSQPPAGPGLQQPMADHTSAFADLDKNELVAMVRQLQLTNQGLRQQTLTAETERDQVANRAKAAKKNGVNNTGPVVGSVTSSETQNGAANPTSATSTPLASAASLALAGRNNPFVLGAHRYGFLHSAWMRVELMHILPPPYELAFHLDRFKDNESHTRGAAAEFYLMFSEEDRSVIWQQMEVRDRIRDIVNRQRCSIICDAKANIESIFAPCGKDTVDALLAQDYDSPHVVSLLQGKNNQLPARFPAILFPAEKVFNAKYMFMSPVLTNIARIFLWGRNILRPIHGPPDPRSSGKKYAIRRITPGLIALAVQAVSLVYRDKDFDLNVITHARFLLLPDEHFNQVGKTSGTHYLKDFEFIKEALMKKLLKGGKKAKEMQALFAHWNHVVFADAWADNTTTTGTGTGLVADDDDQDFLEEWDSPEEDNETEEEDDHPAVRPGRRRVTTAHRYWDPDEEGEYDGSDADEGSEDEDTSRPDSTSAASNGAKTATSAQQMVTGHSSVKPRPIPVPTPVVPSSTSDVMQPVTLTPVVALSAAQPSMPSALIEASNHTLPPTSQPVQASSLTTQSALQLMLQSMAPHAPGTLPQVTLQAMQWLLSQLQMSSLPNGHSTMQTVESPVGVPSQASQVSVRPLQAQLITGANSSTGARAVLAKSYNGPATTATINDDVIFRHSLPGPCAAPMVRQTFDALVAEVDDLMSTPVAIEVPEFDGCMDAAEAGPSSGTQEPQAATNTKGKQRAKSSKKKVIHVLPKLLAVPADYAESCQVEVVKPAVRPKTRSRARKTTKAG